MDQKYLIHAIIGGGSMGHVYRAEHRMLGRQVAVKVLLQTLALQQSQLDRFLREAQAVSRITHPNIVTLLDFGRDADTGLVYIVMEYLQGRALDMVLGEEGPLRLSRVIDLAQQILQALDEAHAQGIVHRDLKPDNAMVIPTRWGERVKMVDFGLAHLMEPDAPKITSSGLVCGTPCYMSPEQARAAAIGPPSDIYSFGVMLYELVTGQLPFEATGAYEMVSKHLTEEPLPPVDRVRSGTVPQELSDLILHCMRKDPGQRPASAREIFTRLERVLVALDGAAPPPMEAHRSLPTRPRAWCRDCGAPVAPGHTTCTDCGGSLGQPPPQPARPTSDSQQPRRSPSGESHQLVGRQAERTTLRIAASRALAGNGSAVLVTGEPGVGKTALLDQIACDLRTLGLQVHRAQGCSRGCGQVWPRMVRTLLGCSPDASDAQVNRALEALGTLDEGQIRSLQFTALIDTPSMLPTAEAQRTACATALNRLLRHTSSRTPLALLVDDAHRLGEWESHLLRAIAPALSTQRVFFLAAARLLTKTLAGPPVRILELRPLASADARTLLGRWLPGRQLPDQLTDDVIQAARGNPLHLEEIARHLDRRMEDREDARPAALTAIPGGLKTLALDRLTLLDPRSQQLLLHAAAIDGGFTPSLLARVVAEPKDLHASLEHLVRADLLVEEKAVGRQPRLRFRQEALRESLCDALSPERRQTIHDRIASLLLDGAEPDVAAETIAHHLTLAGRHAEAADYYQVAAQQQIERRDPEEACRLLRRALNVLQRADDAEPPRSLDLQLMLCGALRESGHASEARAVAITAHQQAQRLVDPLFMFRACYELGCSSAACGERRQAISLMDEAIRGALECGEARIAAEYALDLADLQAMAAAPRRARQTLREALQHLTPGRGSPLMGADDAELRARLHHAVGCAELALGNTAAALAEHQRALEHARFARQHQLQESIIRSLAQTQLSSESGSDEVMPLLEEALALARGAGNHREAVELLLEMAALHRRRGEREEASRLAQAAEDLAVEIDWAAGEERARALEQSATAEPPRPSGDRTGRIHRPPPPAGSSTD